MIPGDDSDPNRLATPTESPANCQICGRPLHGGQCPSCDRGYGISTFVHRELVLLAVLCVIAVVGFFLTRAAAHANHTQRMQDAARWYHTGESELAAGRHDAAIRALRRAVSINRDDVTYRLALAGALSSDEQDDAARQVLVGIREATPEDPEVNLQLARLEARNDDLTGAVRHYQNALYGVWTNAAHGNSEEERRQLRVELIRYLLANQQHGRALSELFVLSGNLPDDVALQSETGQLFLEAGEPRRALEQFRRALRLDPKNVAALAGAGRAAFDAEDYPSALRYLRAAAPDRRAQASPVSELRDVTEFVLSRDPLRPGLPFSERQARLQVDFARAMERLDSCQALSAGGSAQAPLEALRAEAKALEPELAPRRLRRSPDTIETGFELVYRIEQQTVDDCGQASLLDRALLIIGRRHDAERQ